MRREPSVIACLYCGRDVPRVVEKPPFYCSSNCKSKHEIYQKTKPDKESREDHR